MAAMSIYPVELPPAEAYRFAARYLLYYLAIFYNNNNYLACSVEVLQCMLLCWMSSDITEVALTQRRRCY